jgi:hypothetical protein
MVRRRSPRKGRLEDLFSEMVSFPQLLAHPNFSLEVVMVKAEETRRYEGKRRWRRGGWAIDGRRLLEVLGQRLFSDPADWRRLLPEGLESFTATELAAATNTGGRLAQKMAYCLRKANVIELAGRRGRAHVYRVASA